MAKKSILIPDRIFLDCGQTVSPSQPPAELKKRFQELRQQVLNYAQNLDLKELWELLQDEGNDAFSWQELAGFVVPSDEPLAMAGVLDALWNEGVYFKEKHIGEFCLARCQERGGAAASTGDGTPTPASPGRVCGLGAGRTGHTRHAGPAGRE